jgi:hypothetical protein
MVQNEVVEEIAKHLLGLAVLISFLWYVMYRYMERWSKRKPFIFINALILIIYTIYFINGRIYHSEYGGALVWEFYMLLIPFIHTVILGVATVLISRNVNRD